MEQPNPASSIRALVILSDIHAGSTVALLPPGFTTIEGNTIGLSPFQEWLWACWQDTSQWLGSLLGTDPHAMVLNGDLIEGNHHRTTQIISSDVSDHVNAAVDILQPLTARANKLFIVRGTECHTGNREITLAKILGAQDNPELGIPVWDRLTIDVAGIRCVIRHHTPTAVRPYLESGQHSIQMGSEIMEAARNNEPIPRVLCCAHRHRYGAYSDGHSLSVISPPWQGLTRFGHKVVSQARTKPGVYVLDWRGKADGELPHVHSRLYDAPAPKAISL